VPLVPLVINELNHVLSPTLESHVHDEYWLSAEVFHIEASFWIELFLFDNKVDANTG
jgi:hypothetical protein